jgi:hypothetical protein
MMDFIWKVILLIALAIPGIIFLSWIHECANKKAESEQKERLYMNRVVEYYNKHHNSDGDQI